MLIREAILINANRRLDMHSCKMIMKYHGKTKYIQIRYYFVRHMITQNEVVLKHIPTNEMVVDLFTKPTAMDAFVRHVRYLGLCRM